ncbi:uncharacterized protein LOC129308318 [Prosopis cineraria]|uniref:uncharacterized protein LOC129308318 n=1 Tax=Prosopis cineraria TaxID=364024 RepID=UPI0024100F72|nr:uncharacterized protein LOC129308318 [Prosopis cineraria]
MIWASKRWRSFKTSVARRYVHVEVPEGQPWPDPCMQYTFLEAATFEKFFKLRITPEALERRRRAQEIRRMNNCPQIMSHGGYALVDKALMKAKRMKREEVQYDPSILLSPPSLVCRDERWIHAHQKKDGSFSSEYARDVVAKINELKQKQSDRSFILEGRNDILTITIGKPEHPGCVRGVGLGVSIRDVFGLPRQCHSSGLVTREEMTMILAQARAEARVEAEITLEAKLEKMKEAQLRAIVFN